MAEKLDNVMLAALRYAAAGVSVIPIGSDKRPFMNALPVGEDGRATWKPFQSTIADESTIRAWADPGMTGVGIVTGKMSGGLVAVDFDVAGFYERWQEKVGQQADGLPVQRTGGGGYHVFLRCPEVGPNLKLAWVKDPAMDSGRSIAIETRGEGGYIIAAPSVHPSGNLYVMVSGDLAAIPLVTQEVAEALLQAARDLDQAPQTRQQREASAPVFTQPASGQQGGVIGAYNARIPIDDVLVSHGYTRVGERYARPGRDVGSITIKEGRSFHHSTNDPLSDGFWDSAFDIFCKLDHANNCPAAVRAAAKLLEVDLAQRQPPLEPDEVRGSAQSAAQYPADPGKDARPIVVLGTDEYRVTDETVKALADSDQDLFSRGGALVRAARTDDGGGGVRRPVDAMTIQLVNKEWLRDRSTRWVRFCNEIAVKGGTMLVDIHPPTWLVPAVLGRGTWPGIRVLRGISTAPILRPDGSIFQTPGYDSVTGVVCSPTYQTPIMVPDQPTAEQVRQACDLLLEVVVDFPFFSPAHRAAWLAALLTVIARWVFEGKAPLFLFDSNIRGSGKTLQIQTIAMIAFGRDAAMSGYSNDDDEMRKRITSIALAADPLVVLDNLGGVFGGPALDRALTATRWKDRILCTNVEVDLPLDVVWAATGNNIALAADTVRRTVHIRLDCQDESPEKRSGFRHPKLVEWVKDNRERLLAAALTVLSAFLRTKPRPGADLPPFGGFEGWSDVIRGCVVWLGLPDPCSTRAELEATSDTTTGPLAALMDAWEKFVKPGQPIVLSTLLGQLYATREAGRYALTTPEALALRAALEAITRVPAGRPPSAGQVAAKLQTFRRRVIDGCSFEVDAEAGRRGGRAWRLISPAAPLGAPLAPQTGDGRDTGDGLGNAA